MVQVELRPFNDRELNRDLAVLCERVDQVSPRLPDGRRLSFTIRSSCCVLATQEERMVKKSRRTCQISMKCPSGSSKKA